MFRLTLSRQTALLIGAMTMCALALLGALSYLNFEQRSRELRRGTCQALGEDAADAIQRGLDLGLRVADIEAIPEILRRNAARYKAVVAMSVYDHRGCMLFSTDAGASAHALPAAVLAGSLQKPLTKAGRANRSTMYLPLLNSYDKPEGTLVIVYTSMYTTGLPSVRLLLIIGAVGLALLAGVAGSLPIRRAFLSVEREMALMTSALTDPPKQDAGATSMVAEIADFRTGADDLISRMSGISPSDPGQQRGTHA